MLARMDAVEARVFAPLDAAQGDAAAATAAIEGHGPGVFGYLRSLLDDDDAHDAYSQWAEDLWQGLPGFRRECSLRAWSYRLAWHASCRLRRDPYRARGQPLAYERRLAARRLGGGLHHRDRQPARGPRAAPRAAASRRTRRSSRCGVDRELDWDEVAAVLSGEGEPVTRGRAPQAVRAAEGPAEGARARGGAPRRGADGGDVADGACAPARTARRRASRRSSRSSPPPRPPRRRSSGSAPTPRPGAGSASSSSCASSGRGGFGVVFEAFDAELGRRVAFKAVKPSARAAGDPTSCSGARREAVAQLAAPGHRHALRRGALRRGALPHPRAPPRRDARRPRPARAARRRARRCGSALAVSRALVHAHAAGVLHRDLKPSNVFLTADGGVKVLDFGLAHVFGVGAPAQSGTPGYMAPEQLRGGREDARTDVFAVGVLLDEMLAPHPAARGRAARGARGALPGRGSRRAAGRRRRAWRASSGELRAALDRRRGRVPRRAAVRASAVEALRHLFLGEQCSSRPVFGQDCAEHYRRAVALDPTLAVAHYQLSVWTRRFGGSRAAQRRAIARALRHHRSAPPAEQVLIRAFAAHVAGRDGDAIALFREATERWPEDPRAYYEMGDLLRHQDELGLAVPNLERAVALNPDLGWAPGQLAEALGALGREEALRAWVARWSRAPTVVNLHALSIAHGWLGDLDGAAAAARRAVTLGAGLVAQQDLVGAVGFSGRYDAAAELARGFMEPGSPIRRMGFYTMCAVEAYRGRRRAALDWLDALAREIPEVRDDALYVAARADFLLGDGDPAPVLAEVARLEALDPRAAAEHAAGLAWLGADARAAELARRPAAGLGRSPARTTRSPRSGAGRWTARSPRCGPWPPRRRCAPGAPRRSGSSAISRSPPGGPPRRSPRSSTSSGSTCPRVMWRTWAHPRALLAHRAVPRGARGPRRGAGGRRAAPRRVALRGAGRAAPPGRAGARRPAPGLSPAARRRARPALSCRRPPWSPVGLHVATLRLAPARLRRSRRGPRAATSPTSPPSAGETMIALTRSAGRIRPVVRDVLWRQVYFTAVRATPFTLLARAPRRPRGRGAVALLRRRGRRRPRHGARRDPRPRARAAPHRVDRDRPLRHRDRRRARDDAHRGRGGRARGDGDRSVRVPRRPARPRAPRSPSRASRSLFLACSVGASALLSPLLGGPAPHVLLDHVIGALRPADAVALGAKTIVPGHRHRRGRLPRGAPRAGAARPRCRPRSRRRACALVHPRLRLEHHRHRAPLPRVSPVDAAPLAEAQGLTVTARAGALRVEGLAFRLHPGEALVLVGPIEAGSAVLRALLGIDRPDAGQRAAPRRARPATLPRARGGRPPRPRRLVPAERLAPREPDLAREPAPPAPVPPPPDRGRGGARRHRGPGALRPRRRPRRSGRRRSPCPMRRRLALARATLLDPELLVLDDPLDDLEHDVARDVLAALATWTRERPRGLLLTSHLSGTAAALRAPALPLPVIRA